MSLTTDQSSGQVSNRPCATAFAKEAAEFSDKIIKLAKGRRAASRKLDSKAPSLVEYRHFVYFWQSVRLFSQQFASKDFVKDYGNADETCRLDVVIACSYDFEEAFATMEETSDGWRFPGWLKDDGVMLSSFGGFKKLRQDWLTARNELCDALKVLPDEEWELDMSLLIDNDKIDRLPCWISIRDTESGESCRISWTGHGYAEETSIKDPTMKSTVELMKRPLASLSGTKTSDRAWPFEYESDS